MSADAGAAAAVSYAAGAATAEQIAAHLVRCDARFEPSLSARVDIAAYAAKLSAHASRFEAWSDGELVGLVAAYCNDLTRGTAYITSVSVLEKWAGLGIATTLLRRCIDYAKLEGFRQIRLEVSSSSRRAIELYRKCGFSARGPGGSSMSMTIDLGASEAARYARLQR
jgi:ribosomal protein S18 acetylase RimI-like enzyme